MDSNCWDWVGKAQACPFPDVVFPTVTVAGNSLGVKLEMRCYRKIPRISYKDHVTNEEVQAKTQPAIGPHEDLLIIVKRRKLHLYGHVSRSSERVIVC